MKTGKVLVLATYPVQNPQHGGQKRLSAIVSMYERCFSDVKFVSVFHKKIYKDHSREDISLGLESSLLAEKNPLTGDIVCGEAIMGDLRVKKKAVALLQSFKPDIIHIEQPFIYLGLKPLLSELQINPKIVFGSQNIEGPMKREILEGAGMKGEEVELPVRIIDEVEAELSRECDLLVACTEEDLKAHQKMGAKHVVLAQNGIAKSKTTKQDKEYWEKIFEQQGINKTVLFVASAHPPSITGFYDVVGKGLGFMPSDSRILIAGSVCDYFTENISDKNIDVHDATFWLRAFPCGRLSEERLGALLELCDVIILPITEGGGSNLKTAEAILADKKVVTTTHALRSFEWVVNFPNIWVADNKTDFCKAIEVALTTTQKERTSSQQKLAMTVTWEHRLAELESRVRVL